MDNPRTPNPRERNFIIERDGNKCRYCGCTKQPFHIDHVYPFSLGGITSEENLVTSCQRCNSKKHNSVGIWPKPIGYFDENKNPTLKPSSIISIGLGLFYIFMGFDMLLGNVSGFLMPRFFILAGLLISSFTFVGVLQEK